MKEYRAPYVGPNYFQLMANGQRKKTNSQEAVGLVQTIHLPGGAVAGNKYILFPLVEISP